MGSIREDRSKRKNRIIAVVTLVMMVASMFPLTAFALADESDYDQPGNVEEYVPVAEPEEAPVPESEETEPTPEPEVEQEEAEEAEHECGQEYCICELQIELPDFAPLGIAPLVAPTFTMPPAPTAPVVNEAGRATETVGTLAALRPLLDNPNGTPLTITLSASIAVTGETLRVTHPDVIVQPAAAQAITRGSGGAGSNFPAITVDGGTLVLRAQVNRSGAAGTGARSGGIHVVNGGTLIMDSPNSRVNAFISNTANNAGGVTVVGTGSTFHMLRGQIDNNEGTGGGVLVRDGGTFNMFGGRIYRNEENVGRQYYTGGGGVRIMAGGTFNMVGGTPTIDVVGVVHEAFLAVRVRR